MFGVPLHRNQHTGVAQLVEYRSPKPAVGSSSLSSRAKQIDKKGNHFDSLFLCLLQTYRLHFLDDNVWRRKKNEVSDNRPRGGTRSLTLSLHINCAVQKYKRPFNHQTKSKKNTGEVETYEHLLRKKERIPCYPLLSDVFKTTTQDNSDNIFLLLCLDSSWSPLPNK